MNKLLMTIALLSLLAFPAMADEGKGTGVLGGSAGVSRDVDLGAGYYNSPEELAERLARLKAQQAAGKQCYGNSNCYPIANAIAKTQRKLNLATCGSLYC